MDTPSSVLQALRRESLDIYNRLHSIADDALFVAHVHAFYSTVPLAPNLRCGAWYADPVIASTVPAYFKSTDGHFNNWGFNLRRPNLQLLPLIAQRHSIVLVDSTRAGKRIPDALSKTVPIWCAVLNRAIARRFPGPEKDAWDTALYTPPAAVSAQEHHQIELRIDAWADALFNSSFELPALPAPLRPFWITPATTTFPSVPTSDPPPFLPIICLSASRQSEDARRTGGFAYIQGSGDDHELWGLGLTPTHYWRHRPALLAASRSELPNLIKTILTTDSSSSSSNSTVSEANANGSRVTPITKVDGRMKLCTFAELERVGPLESSSSAYVLLSATREGEGSTKIPSGPALTLPLAPRIKTHLTQTLLPRALPFIGAQLARGRSVCVVCGGEEEVGDEGTAVLLAALVVFFDDDGRVRDLGGGHPSAQVEVGAERELLLGAGAGAGMEETKEVLTVVIPPETDKARIRTRLEWIIACRAGVNPARATLKRVNEFLMSAGRKGR
ncbi:hypothetical protein D9615_009160 [Tricholomella constricta]|uniref:Initiator tRNA phosphoribosyl transferase n=1 Tax=Tricholomella constricta TaxID=117010 RepID=A0A8H5LZR3_9AGAR|nr:hypothetical protein D9615_009160 [Tricholomella constricta]